MEKELIKTDNYLLVVDDSEIKEGDYRVNIQRGYVKLADKEGLDYYNKRSDVFKKAIAHLPLNNSPILEGVPLLPQLEVEGDVEKLNEDLFDKGSDNVLHPQYQMRTFFNMGYNKAKEKYKFTEEDAKYLFECGRNFQINADITFTVAREHLLQPKTPTHFEFEVVWHNTYSSETQQYDAQELKLKTTTNSQGQQLACGKYIY